MNSGYSAPDFFLESPVHMKVEGAGGVGIST